MMLPNTSTSGFISRHDAAGASQRKLVGVKVECVTYSDDDFFRGAPHRSPNDRNEDKELAHDPRVLNIVPKSNDASHVEPALELSAHPK